MEYDVIIIGGGPGGYVAAERTAARGHKTLLIEKSELGGVCLNEGCIPTKTLLNSAKLYAHGLEAEQFGVSFDNPRFDLSAAMKWKEKVVKTLVKGVAYQMKRHGVDVVKGQAEFVDRTTVEADGTRYTGKNIIIASGSSPLVPPIPGAGSPAVMTSSEVLTIDTMPASVAVIGGGVIGMEFASFFSSFGVKVDVIEMLEEILPTMDGDLSKLMRKEMKGAVNFHLGSRVVSIDGGTVTYETGGERESLEADIVLMSVGRRPNVGGIGLDRISLDYTERGINVDEKMRTSLPGVYAIGDVTGKSFLAHSASRMGEVAAAVISGDDDRMRYHAVPWVVYTQPEAAGCGLTEAEAEVQGRTVRTASLPMRVSGRFYAENGNKSGICKVVTDADTGVLLGVHLLGGVSSEIIYGASAMIEAELRVKDIREIIFPHPTVAEIIRDTLWEL